jgi:hypothetical protein
MTTTNQEQRSAAATHVFGESYVQSPRMVEWVKTGINADDHTGLDLNGADGIAELIAEREHKLREELSGLDALDATMSDLVEVRAALHAARARIAELEGQCASSIEDQRHQATCYVDREAAHIANIKALRALFDRIDRAQFENYEDAYRAIYKCGGYDLVKQAKAVFANYPEGG